MASEAAETRARMQRVKKKIWILSGENTASSRVEMEV